MKVPREVTIERERRAWELRQQLWTHARIAAALGVDESTVSRILARLSTRYGERHAEAIDALKSEQIAQLQHLADEAYQAWERSKQPAETITTKSTTVVGIAVGDEAPEPVDDLVTDILDGSGLANLPAIETTRKVEGQVGDPAYLAEVRGALADIRKITGANAPTKIAPTTPDGAQAWAPGPAAVQAALAQLAAREPDDAGA